MKGINHLTVTVILANIVGIFLLKPTTLIDGLLFSMGMISVAFGSLAPDIDIKHSMVRKWYVALLTLPFWITQLCVYGVLGKIYGFKHRGVMHSLIGWATSFAAIGVLAEVMFGRIIAMAICGGFAFGYLAHLIEDVVSTKTRIDWIPTSRLWWSCVLGVVAVLLVICVVPFACAAGEPDPEMPEPGDPITTIKEISFGKLTKNVDKFLSIVFWFAVKVVISYAAIMAIANKAHKSISSVQGILIAFLIVYVLPGILRTLVS